MDEAGRVSRKGTFKWREVEVWKCHFEMRALAQMVPLAGLVVVLFFFKEIVGRSISQMKKEKKMVQNFCFLHLLFFLFPDSPCAV